MTPGSLRTASRILRSSTSTGRPIDEYCRDRQLDVRARLRLFAQVAAAVAYAHGKLIVHRDLKPSNILVTADGQVRLLDFGIAKLLEEDHAKETRLTELSGRALTPDYASPEQILGEPLTIASDVYSLGVILYELLSGTRPYKLKRDSRGALEDAIVQTDPAPPSAVVDEQAGKALRGDLDTIVLKALKKRPEERYLTVHAFADDIDRYLDGRPVLARPDSARYRLGKFIARQPAAGGRGGRGGARGPDRGGRRRVAGARRDRRTRARRAGEGVHRLDHAGRRSVCQGERRTGRRDRSAEHRSWASRP